MTDWYLIRRFREDRSEAAFAQLVSRYLKLVYSVCYAELQNAQAAEDATQAVFLILARKAEFHRGSTLASWLFRTATYVARHTRRAELRRRRREIELEKLHHGENPFGGAGVEETQMLNEALSVLRDADREALLLRYYQEMSLAEIGDALGVSEDAARKRIARGLDKVRAYLGRHGVANAIGVLTAGMAITVPLKARSEAMVYAISQSLTPAVGLAASTAVNQLTLEVLKKMAMMKLKWTVACAIVIAGAGSGTAYVMGQGIGGGAGPGGSAPNAAQSRSLPASNGRSADAATTHASLAKYDAAIQFLTEQKKRYARNTKLAKKKLEESVRHVQARHRQNQSSYAMAKHNRVINGDLRDYLLLKDGLSQLDRKLITVKRDRAIIAADDKKRHDLSRMPASLPKTGLTDREAQGLKAQLSSLSKPLMENELQLLKVQLAAILSQKGAARNSMAKAEVDVITYRSGHSLLPRTNSSQKRQQAELDHALTMKYAHARSDWESLLSQQSQLETQITNLKDQLGIQQKT
ncbi:MAG: polymerase, sigma-24 subunit, subfamily [Capsulimonas sp.]|nr:polymerase, sigma-24 subunit, subfamily [Capsulimonas sp.]